MRLLFWVVAVVALAGCEADGRPSQLWGSAADGFARGYGDGPSVPTPTTRPPISPMRASPPPAPATAQAFFTGSAEQVQTVSGGMAWKCEYHYGGQDFVLMFENYCPPSASVR